MAAPTDELLLQVLAAGRAEAFAAVYDRYGPQMYRAAAAILGDAQEAQDAVQDVFVALVRGRAALPGVRNLPAYLAAALRRAAVARLTRRMRATTLRLDDIAPPPAPRGAEAGEADGTLQRALDSLPAEQRQVLMLKVDAEMTFQEIAAAVGISANTAASRYRYALEKMRERLSNDGRL
jgi:RNA polymerase sigma-70 factor, ECF subfamily